MRKRATPLDEEKPVGLHFGFAEEEEGLDLEFALVKAKWNALFQAQGMEPPAPMDDAKIKAEAAAALAQRMARADAFLDGVDQEEEEEDFLAKYTSDHAQYLFYSTWYEVEEGALSEQERAIWRRVVIGHNLFQQTWVEWARAVQRRVQELALEMGNPQLASFLAHVSACRLLVAETVPPSDEAKSLWTGKRTSTRMWRVVLIQLRSGEPDAAALMTMKQARLLQHLHVIYHYSSYVKAALERALSTQGVNLNAVSAKQAWARLERDPLLARLAGALRVARRSWLS